MIWLIRGQVGTEVELTLRRAGREEDLQVTLERAELLTNSVVWKPLDPHISLVQISQFDGHTAEKVRAGLRRIREEGKDGLIIDLRGNPGGLLDASVEITDMFLEKGRSIVEVHSRVRKERRVSISTHSALVDLSFPITILVDGRTASAAEVMAGALKYHGRATLIGTATFGKGAVNRVFDLPGESGGIHLTVAHYTAGDGMEIEGKGIKPDIVAGEIPPPPSPGTEEEQMQWQKQYSKAREQQLERALQHLKEQIP
jgi:carboxyl-terminal processing protease